MERRPGDRCTLVRSFRYRLVDVFAQRPFTGSNLAVFPDARGLDTVTMQAIARELNRPQTSFVLPSDDPSAPPRIRVFTPAAEIPRANSQTVGTAFVLDLEQHSGAERVVFETNDGPVSVSSFARVLTVRQPLPKLGSVYPDTQAVMAMLGLKDSDRMQGIPIQAAASTTPFLIVTVRNQDALRRICFRADIWERTVRQFEASSPVVFTLETDRAGSAAKLRVFTPGAGVFEEPATEACCGPLALFMARYGFLSFESPQLLVLEQGLEVGRPSMLHVAIERSSDTLTSVRVGGQCVSVGEGTIFAAVTSAD